MKIRCLNGDRFDLRRANSEIISGNAADESPVRVRQSSSARARVERRMPGYGADGVVAGRGANQDEARPSNPANPGRNAGPSIRHGSGARKPTARAAEGRTQTGRFTSAPRLFKEAKATAVTARTSTRGRKRMPSVRLRD